MKMNLVAVREENGQPVAVFERSCELPFVPSIGMKFRKGGATWLFETSDGEEEGRVSDLSYDFDEEAVYVLFKVSRALTSSFWIPTDPKTSGAISQFYR